MAHVDTPASESMLELQLLLQQLRFTVRDAFLSWNIVDKNGSTTAANGLRYLIYNNSCDSADVTTLANTTDTSAVLSLEGQGNAYLIFDVTAFDKHGEQYSTIDEIFRIKSGGM